VATVVVAFVPSPKPQLYDNGETPPVELVVKVTSTPTSGEAGDATGAVAPVRRAATTTEVVPEADLTPLARVIVTAARNEPAEAYTRVTMLVEVVALTLPSPKPQL